MGIAEQTDALLALLTGAAMLAEALPRLLQPAPRDDSGLSEPPFTPEQAKEVVAALEALAIDCGTVSSSPDSGSYGLTDADKRWPAGLHRGRLARVTDRAGFSQARAIQDTVEDGLVVETPWSRPVEAGSRYVIIDS